MAILLPRPMLAQTEKTELTLTLLPRPYDNEVRVGEDNKLFLEVRNTGTRAVTLIRLSAETPEGWSIEFKTQGIDYLGTGEAKTVDLIIRTASRTSEGSYTVTLIAEASEIRKVEGFRLTAKRAELTLALFPRNNDNEVKVGEDNRLFLEVRNTGTKAVTSVRLSSEKPEGWLIEFKPAEIAYLAAGSVQTVDLIVRPDSRTTKGGYSITLIADFIAEANEIRKVESIWLTVKTASFWIWVGGIIGAVVVAVFIYIFIRFNRQ